MELPVTHMRKSPKTDMTPNRRRHASTGDDPMLLEIGDRVRAVRAGAKMTQEELALVSGVGREFIIQLENGKPGVSLGNAARVLRSLGLKLRTAEK